VSLHKCVGASHPSIAPGRAPSIVAAGGRRAAATLVLHCTSPVSHPLCAVLCRAGSPPTQRAWCPRHSTLPSRFHTGPSYCRAPCAVLGALHPPPTAAAAADAAASTLLLSIQSMPAAHSAAALSATTLAAASHWWPFFLSFFSFCPHSTTTITLSPPPSSLHLPVRSSYTALLPSLSSSHPPPFVAWFALPSVNLVRESFVLVRACIASSPPAATTAPAPTGTQQTAFPQRQGGQRVE